MLNIPQASPVSAVEESSIENISEETTDGNFIKSPMVGTFMLQHLLGQSLL